MSPMVAQVSIEYHLTGTLDKKQIERMMQSQSATMQSAIELAFIRTVRVRWSRIIWAILKPLQLHFLQPGKRAAERKCQMSVGV